MYQEDLHSRRSERLMQSDPAMYRFWYLQSNAHHFSSHVVIDPITRNCNRATISISMTAPSQHNTGLVPSNVR